MIRISPHNGENCGILSTKIRVEDLEEHIRIDRVYNNFGDLIRQDANFHIPEKGCREVTLTVPRDGITNDDVWGDGSSHLICTNCKFCITCGDCVKHGCGKEEQKLENLQEKTIQNYRERTGEQ